MGERVRRHAGTKVLPDRVRVPTLPLQWENYFALGIDCDRSQV